MEAFVRRIGVAPGLTARSRVDGPDVVWRGDVDHAVDENRGRLDLSASDSVWNAHASVSWLTLSGVMLRQAAVMLARVVAVIGRPAVGRRLQQQRRDRRFGRWRSSHGTKTIASSEGCDQDLHIVYLSVTQVHDEIVDVLIRVFRKLI